MFPAQVATSTKLFTFCGEVAKWLSAICNGIYSLLLNAEILVFIKAVALPCPCSVSPWHATLCCSWIKLWAQCYVTDGMIVAYVSYEWSAAVTFWLHKIVNAQLSHFESHRFDTNSLYWYEASYLTMWFSSTLVTKSFFLKYKIFYL